MKKWMEFRVKVIHDFMAKARGGGQEGQSRPQVRRLRRRMVCRLLRRRRELGQPAIRYRGQIRLGNGRVQELRLRRPDEPDAHRRLCGPEPDLRLDRLDDGGLLQPGHGAHDGRLPDGGRRPDVGNWDYEDKFTQEEENQAVKNSVAACINACDGYFLFDMIHLKKADQWSYAKAGIDAAISEEK